ncbi:hypothetical protein [Halobellus ruber]|uniref:Uncharacterized protein n=1 Tax=Halobellus ruber TaxID=2761102 RepID=A0A7J9SDS5_9EURY|nr:hypothetical protein [Halobellus ruber]MBB6645074.1 hypothetical protein [Halobellus ruber]
MTLKEWLTHPITVLTGSLGVIGIGIEPALIKGLFAALWATAPTLFTASSITAFTIAPEINVLEPLQPVAVGVALITGGIYLAKLGNRALEEFQKRL